MEKLMSSAQDAFFLAVVVILMRKTDIYSVPGPKLQWFYCDYIQDVSKRALQLYAKR
jgi:hypothetical protein